MSYLFIRYVHDRSLHLIEENFIKLFSNNNEKNLVCNKKVDQVYNPFLGLYDQVIKSTRWMPWQLKAMKDVVTCDKLRGGGKQPLIRRFPNGRTQCA